MQASNRTRREILPSGWRLSGGGRREYYKSAFIDDVEQGRSRGAFVLPECYDSSLSRLGVGHWGCGDAEDGAPALTELPGRRRRQAMKAETEREKSDVRTEPGDAA